MIFQCIRLFRNSLENKNADRREKQEQEEVERQRSRFFFQVNCLQIVNCVIPSVLLAASSQIA